MRIQNQKKVVFALYKKNSQTAFKKLVQQNKKKELLIGQSAFLL